MIFFLRDCCQYSSHLPWESMKNNILIFVCAFTLFNVIAGDCVDKQKDCAALKRFCKQEGATGAAIRRVCRKTCGTCLGCGRPDVKGITRVIAGKTAIPHSWPWQILMLDGGRAMCGGTLVSPQWVVTAAHCVYRRETSGRFSVVVGKHDRENHDNPEETIKVAKVIRHPQYVPIRNDIAMFKLERPVKFNKYVSPACLPKADVPAGTDCYITGWGHTTQPGSMSHYLQQGLMPVVSKKACAHKIRHLHDSMICGGDGGVTEISGCQGDSGGPYVCKVGGVWELHGSVSMGRSDCSSESYTVFARTYYFIDWIKNNMKNH